MFGTRIEELNMRGFIYAKHLDSVEVVIEGKVVFNIKCKLSMKEEKDDTGVLKTANSTDSVRI